MFTCENVSNNNNHLPEGRVGHIKPKSLTSNLFSWYVPQKQKENDFFMYMSTLGKSELAQQNAKDFWVQPTFVHNKL